jgi:PIN domain nuclease of toxin-antitoxin system
MLLDSNILIFWTLRSPLLPLGVSSAIREAPDVSISIATIWELEIKRGIGKFGSALDWDDLTTNHVRLLPIEIDDAIVAAALPLHHRDPFDRMIIAQAKRRGLPIVTRDRAFQHYGVPVIWA